MLQNTMLRLSIMLAILLVAASCFRRIDTETNFTTPFTNVDEAQIDDLLLEMTVEQKIGQLIIGKSSIHYDWDSKILSEWLTEGKVGGLLLQNLELEKYLDFVANQKGTSTLPSFFATDEKVALHNQFSDLVRFPTPATISSIDSIEIQNTLAEHYIKQCKGLGINLSFSPTLFQNFDLSKDYNFNCFESDPIESMARSIKQLNTLKENRILSIGDAFNNFHDPENTDFDLDSTLNKYIALIEGGLSGLKIGDSIFEIDSLEKLPPHFLSEYINKQLNYNGLLVSEITEKKSLEEAFHIGIDLFVCRDVSGAFNFLKEKYDSGILSKTILNQKVRKVLMAKSWMNGGKLKLGKSPFPQTVSQEKNNTNSRLISQTAAGKSSKKKLRNIVKKYFTDPVWNHFIRMVYEQSVILANNPKQTIPYLELYAKDFRIIQFSDSHLETFKHHFSKYAPYASYLYRPNQRGVFSNFKLNDLRWSLPVIVLDEVDLNNPSNQLLIESINKLIRKTNAVLINFGNPNNLQYFDSSLTTIQVFEKNEITEAFAARLLFGGASTSGKLPIHLSPNYPFRTGSKNKIIRLEYSKPEDVGIDENRLGLIDSLAQFAIQDTMTPGCQILIAKDGHVVYSKAFGKHTYKENQRVKTSDLYDIASITKIAATTVAAMKLVDEKEIDIDKKLGSYLEKIDSPAIQNIVIRELLVHQSGLQPNMPIGKYLSRRNLDKSKGIFSRSRNENYSLQVSNSLFINEVQLENIWKNVFSLEVGNKEEYSYSDVNFNILQKIIETTSETSIDEFTFQNFYKPLGMQRVAFLPLKTFPKHEIVPTEEDNKWRNELLRGFPHDQTAAIFGGVAGSAGLFANAEDLAVLFQMLLKKGLYGNIQYLKPETVEIFTSTSEENQRGLGFNKPGKKLASGCSDYASPATFGHSGFTGTCVWVDPNEDLIYIFLSNRVHPKASNRKLIREGIRTKIHDVVYNSLNTFDMQLPDLEMSTIKG